MVVHPVAIIYLWPRSTVETFLPRTIKASRSQIRHPVQIASRRTLEFKGLAKALSSPLYMFLPIHLQSSFVNLRPWYQGVIILADLEDLPYGTSIPLTSTAVGAWSALGPDAWLQLLIPIMITVVLFRAGHSPFRNCRWQLGTLALTLCAMRTYFRMRPVQVLLSDVMREALSMLHHFYLVSRRSKPQLQLEAAPGVIFQRPRILLSWD